MKNIITIQHAQSEQHINKMIGSLGDWNLTELGIKQAHSIGKNLADDYKNQNLLYTPLTCQEQNKLLK